MHWEWSVWRPAWPPLWESWSQPQNSSHRWPPAWVWVSEWVLFPAVWLVSLGSADTGCISCFRLMAVTPSVMSPLVVVTLGYCSCIYLLVPAELASVLLWELHFCCLYHRALTVTPVCITLLRILFSVLTVSQCWKCVWYKFSPCKYGVKVFDIFPLLKSHSDHPMLFLSCCS